MTALFEPHRNSLALLQARCGAHASQAGGHAAGLMPLHTLLACIRADLQADLFPALFESMAGSDALCLRDMQARVAIHLNALDAPGTHGPAWRQAGEALVAFETAELLPLAGRLLDDQAVAQVLQAMRARRGVP